MKNFARIWSRQRARAQRLYRDWRDFQPHEFARRIRFGRTGCRHLLCQYASPIPLQLRNKARLQNLQLYGEQLSHVLIQPQQIFSLWRLLRTPGALRGLKVGPHFDGRSVTHSYEMGLGQIASILHYLALYLGLEIMECHAAEIPPKGVNHEIVPLGFEACVTWMEKDFRFRNPFNFDLALQWQCNSDEVVGTVFATQIMELNVKLEGRILETLPQKIIQEPSQAPAEPGQIVQKGSEGYRVQLVRETIQDEAISSQQFLGERSYAPVDRIVLI